MWIDMNGANRLRLDEENRGSRDALRPVFRVKAECENRLPTSNLVYFSFLGHRRLQSLSGHVHPRQGRWASTRGSQTLPCWSPSCCPTWQQGGEETRRPVPWLAVWPWAITVLPRTQVIK